ncbi:MAG: class I SAM-dependent methyltransferase [Betaproteobacteria bacterium]|nr:class I SAM-dependent methyltransferase [Betaproteobacteria bacterium]
MHTAPFTRIARHAFLALSLSFTASVALAQSSEFKPEVGQAGKDVVWVPTSQALVDKMLDMAKVTASDYVIDLGSGDGRTVITAAKRGARAHGIEYNPDMVDLSKKSAEKEGVTGRATFAKADIFESDFSQATVITLFLLPQLNLRLRPQILALKPGTRVVSNSFTMAEWQDDETFTLDARDSCNYWCVAHYWVVPAKVEGTWKTSFGELALTQQFQMVSGTLRGTSGTSNVTGKLLGDQITLIAGNTTYAGRVNGNAMEGGGSGKWSASKLK